MKTVIIDLDNVIIDTNEMIKKLIEEMIEQALKMFNAKIEKKELRVIAYNKYKELCQKIGNHDFNLYLALDYIKGFLLGCEWNTDDYIMPANLRTLDRLAWDIRNYFVQNIKLVEGGLELLTELFDNKSIKSVVVYMSGHGDFQEFKVQETLNLLDKNKYFSDIYVTPRKDAQTLYALLTTCDCIKNLEDVIVISNNFYDDIVPAKKLGLEAIFIDKNQEYFGLNNYIKKLDIICVKDPISAINKLKDLLNNNRRVA